MKSVAQHICQFQIKTSKDTLCFPDLLSFGKLGISEDSSPSLTGWQDGNNTNQGREKQLSKAIYDADLMVISWFPLEDTRRISEGMKRRFRSSQCTRQHPWLVPALIIICHHSGLIPILWVPIRASPITLL